MDPDASKTLLIITTFAAKNLCMLGLLLNFRRGDKRGKRDGNVECRSAGESVSEGTRKARHPTVAVRWPGETRRLTGGLMTEPLQKQDLSGGERHKKVDRKKRGNLGKKVGLPGNRRLLTLLGQTPVGRRVARGGRVKSIC